MMSRLTDAVRRRAFLAEESEDVCWAYTSCTDIASFMRCGRALS